VRNAIGDDIDLMVDFNQAVNLADALRRCHMIDDQGLVWIEQPVVYDDFDSCVRLAAELKSPIQIGENFYGPRDVRFALQKACGHAIERAWHSRRLSPGSSGLRIFNSDRWYILLRCRLDNRKSLLRMFEEFFANAHWNSGWRTASRQFSSSSPGPILAPPLTPS
jgi:hypothetical protein